MEAIQPALQVTELDRFPKISCLVTVYMRLWGGLLRQSKPQNDF
jgi:hypothetical protein